MTQENTLQLASDSSNKRLTELLPQISSLPGEQITAIYRLAGLLRFPDADLTEKALNCCKHPESFMSEIAKLDRAHEHGSPRELLAKISDLLEAACAVVQVADDYTGGGIEEAERMVVLRSLGAAENQVLEALELSCSLGDMLEEESETRKARNFELELCKLASLLAVFGSISEESKLDTVGLISLTIDQLKGALESVSTWRIAE